MEAGAVYACACGLMKWCERKPHVCK